ncbi:MAG: hypothetical protein AB2L24_13140 [Mangrovibacterium sp.]
MSYLLRLLLIILLAYYIFRFLNRHVFSLFRGPDERPRHRENASRRPEGDVRIENNRSKNSRIPRDEGEYVDFEEID